MKALTAGTALGLSVDQMVDKLEDWPFERYQAARIVRTEVNRASNVGQRRRKVPVNTSKVKNGYR